MTAPAVVQTLHCKKRMEEVKHTPSKNTEGNFEVVLMN